MYKGFEIIEVTKENKYDFLSEIVKLEETVLNNMRKQGKKEQFFTTGEKGISDYIDSNYAHVFVACIVDENSGKKKPISVTYITEGQTPFTYNDITKYFKYGDEYNEFIRTKYPEKEKYLETIRKIYIDKIKAFRYARNDVLNSLGYSADKNNEEYNNQLLRTLIEKELINPQNRFHEKSEIREKINETMSRYMRLILKESKEYEMFYWLDFKTLTEILNNNATNKSGRKRGKNKHNKYDTTMQMYDDFLEYQKYTIYEKSEGLISSKYFTANTENTIELDTYLTLSQSRKSGLARIVVFEALRKSILEQKNNTTNEEIFLASTLHRDNLSSKYVSEFFELKDNLFLNRRCGIDREVHICRIKREEIDNYLEKMEKKLIVLYSYNPRNVLVSSDEKVQILNEQIEYEKQEVERLKLLTPKEKYADYINNKKRKIDLLNKQLKTVLSKKDFSDNDGDYSDK